MPQHAPLNRNLAVNKGSATPMREKPLLQTQGAQWNPRNREQKSLNERQDHIINEQCWRASCWNDSGLEPGSGTLGRRLTSTRGCHHYMWSPSRRRCRRSRRRLRRSRCCHTSTTLARNTCHCNTLNPYRNRSQRRDPCHCRSIWRPRRNTSRSGRPRSKSRSWDRPASRRASN